MQNIKDNIRQKLVDVGRVLVCEKGIEFLTARKLSEASGCSIGTIYNQFSSMDELAAEENLQTMCELESALGAQKYGSDSYENINKMIDVFAGFVVKHQQLWLLFYNFHQNRRDYVPQIAYKKQMIKLMNFGRADFGKLYSKLKGKRSQIMREVLFLGLFAISSMVAANMLNGLKTVNHENICRIFANAFLAGIMLLEKD